MLILVLGKKAREFLSKLPPKQYTQIEAKLLQLRQNPFPQDWKHLKGFEWNRVDVGEYRIIYMAQKGILDVPLIGKRNDNEVYKQLKRLEG